MYNGIINMLYWIHGNVFCDFSNLCKLTIEKVDVCLNNHKKYILLMYVSMIIINRKTNDYLV